MDISDCFWLFYASKYNSVFCNICVAQYSSFSLPSFNEMAGAAMHMQALHEQRERYLSSLVDFVTDALSQNIDSILENELKMIYADLKTFYKKPLAKASVYADLRQQEIKIRDAIIRYNKRVQEQQKRESESTKKQEEAQRKAQEQAKDAPSSGTGFFLSKDGYIATNYHVIADAKTLAITGVNGDYNTTYSVSVEQVDTYNDLAILKVNDTQFKQLANNPPYKIRQSLAEIGENCYVLGYPLISTMGTDIKLTNGIISARTGFQGDVSQYQISAPVQPGNSGGPLFDKNGNIVGVVSAKHTGAENAGYAIKTSYLQNLIELVEPAISLPQYNTLLGKSLPEQVKLSKNYVCIILANVVKEQENGNTVAPNHLITQIELARNKIEMKQFQSAIDILNQVEKMDNTYGVIYRFRSDAYYELGDSRKAVDDLIKYMKITHIDDFSIQRLIDYSKQIPTYATARLGSAIAEHPDDWA
ncbi:serine protease [Alistipes senegalensis]|uniref:S1 family peptidase n=1 Tax=Alistipes senegalensis TaxID=1288121 RepID=UPI0018A9F56A|nr:serine protease [Alistipes senegalensis]